jgi:hypothetical protein
MSAKLEALLEQVGETLIPRVSVGTNTVGTTLTSIQLGAGNGGSIGEELPDRFYLWRIQVFLTALTGGATEVELGLSLDDQGTEPASEYVTKRIAFADDPSSGGAVFAYSAPGSPMWTDSAGNDATGGRLFARVRLNSGAATAHVYVTWTAAFPR